MKIERIDNGIQLIADWSVDNMIDYIYRDDTIDIYWHRDDSILIISKVTTEQLRLDASHIKITGVRYSIFEIHAVDPLRERLVDHFEKVLLLQL